MIAATSLIVSWKLSFALQRQLRCHLVRDPDLQACETCVRHANFRHHRRGDR